MRIIMREAQLDNHIKVSPCHHITLPSVKRVDQRFLSVAEIERLADGMESRCGAVGEALLGHRGGRSLI